MRLFIDTNVILDLLENREPFVDDAVRLFKLQTNGHVSLLVTDLTFVNIAYITRKTYPHELLYSALHKVRPFLEVITIGGAETIDKVLDLEPKDFKDGVQCLAANRANADYIITRNKKDFYFSEVPVLSPSEFLIKWNDKD